MIASVGLWVIDTTMQVDRLPEAGESIAVSAIGRSEGGKAANQIVAAARLGAETALVGVIGEQPGWQDPLDTLRKEGVDVHFVRHTDAPNGFSVILLADTGEQVIATYSGPGAVIDVQATLGSLSDLGVHTLLLQGETDSVGTLALARKFSGRVILDPSPVDSFVGLNLSFVDILTPNLSEAQQLTSMVNPSAEDVRRATGAPCVIVTRGSDGVEVVDGTGAFTVPTLMVAAVDPTGAGDAFNGALAAMLDQGKPLPEAVLFATQVAAWSVQRMHCIPSYPMLNDLTEMAPSALGAQARPESVKENR